MLSITQGTINRFIASLSGFGFILGTLFFAAALTPSLVPRSYMVQGVLAGTAFAAGYGIGVFLRWLWAYLQLPLASQQMRRAVNISLAAGCLVVAGFALNLAADWQNSVRAVMHLEPVPSAYPVSVCLIAILTFIVLLILARLLQMLKLRITAGTKRFLPDRLAILCGFLVTVALTWTLANGVLVSSAFTMLDKSFRELDASIEPDQQRPDDAMRTGSAASLLRWEELGRTGRQFIASSPTANEISLLSGRPAREPVRVYAGLQIAGTAQQRADLALQELIRQKGFERSILVIITPTGTGWIDPAAMDGLEILHDGDVASIAMQYSYLNSPLSLIFQPEYGAEAARVLFTTVYDYWKALPRDQRPRLYLHGLSLGAMNSERSIELFEMLENPIQGALWSGPPFPTRDWRNFTDRRNPGSPAWLPIFRDGAFVRFMNQDGLAKQSGESWGPLRSLYLQYASDPITFFEASAFYRQPDWMNEPRGPDVSPEFRWYPVVTMLQLLVDLAFGTATPMGYGHVFAPEHYVDGWITLTDPTGWDKDRIDRLKAHLRAKFDKDQDENVEAQRGG